MDNKIFGCISYTPAIQTLQGGMRYYAIMYRSILKLQTELKERQLGQNLQVA